MPAAMIANTAYWKSPLNAKRIAVIPAHSASNVSTLGTMRLNDASDNRRRMRGRRVRPRTRSLGDRIAKGALLIAKPLPASIHEFGSRSDAGGQCATPPSPGEDHTGLDRPTPAEPRAVEMTAPQLRSRSSTL